MFRNWQINQIIRASLLDRSCMAMFLRKWAAGIILMIAVLCPLGAVHAEQAEEAATKGGADYNIVNLLAPLILDRYLEKHHLNDFTRAASENLLPLYNYKAEEISEKNSVYTNLALWIAQTSLRPPAIYQAKADGRFYQMDNYFFHWEEQTEAYQKMVEDLDAKKKIEKGRSWSAIKDAPINKEMQDRIEKFKDKMVEIKNDFKVLRRQLKAIVGQQVKDKAKATNLQQRLDQAELVFADNAELKDSLKKALFDSPAINHDDKIYVAPEMYKFPKGAVKLTLAHELAHSIDFLHITRKVTSAKIAREGESLNVVDLEGEDLVAVAAAEAARKIRSSLDDNTLPYRNFNGRPSGKIEPLAIVDHPYFPLLKQWQTNQGYKDLDLYIPENFDELTADDQRRFIRNGKLTWREDKGFVHGNFRGNEIFADYLASLVINDDINKIADPIAQTRYAVEAVMFNMTNAMDLRWIDFYKLIRAMDRPVMADDEKKVDGEDTGMDALIKTVSAVIDAHLQFVLKSSGYNYPLLPARVNFYAQPEEIRNALRVDRLRAFQKVYLQELEAIKANNEN